MGPKIRQAIKEAIGELIVMDRNELRSEIQNREIGEIGSILLETGALETGPLHVAVDIPTWDEPVEFIDGSSSWVCHEQQIPVAPHTARPRGFGVTTPFVSSAVAMVAFTCVEADNVSRDSVVPSEADDYYPYSVAA
jgi:hypothetical protein